MGTGVIILLSLCLSATALTPEQKDDLRQFVRDVMECRTNVAASVSLVRLNETVFAEGFGFRDLEAELPMESNTRISIASESKAFTATLAAFLVADGLVEWDTPFTDILGEGFQLQDQFRTEQASLRDALSHRLAMPNYWGVSTAGTGFTRAALVNRLRFFPPRFNFRQQYLYSNYPYILAAWLTEQLSGETWEQHMRSAIFEPLGMDDSKVSAEMTAEDWDNTAYSYSYVDGEYRKHDEQGQLPFLTEIGPSAAVFTTAEDIAKWMRFHLNGGKTESGEELIPESFLQDTYRGSSSPGRENPFIRRPRFPVSDVRGSYGMGWYSGIYRDMEKIWHTGSYSGYNCRLTMIPEKQVGAWACVSSPGTSQSSRAVRLITMYALDLLLGEDPWLNGTTACSFPDPWSTNDEDDDEEDSCEGETHESPQTQRPHNQNQILKSKAGRTDYEGVYSHDGFGFFTVYNNETDGSLRFVFGMLLSGTLEDPEDDFTFHMILDPPLEYRQISRTRHPLTFLTDEEDNIDAVEVPYLERSLPPVFTRVL